MPRTPRTGCAPRRAARGEVADPLATSVSALEFAAEHLVDPKAAKPCVVQRRIETVGANRRRPLSERARWMIGAASRVAVCMGT